MLIQQLIQSDAEKVFVVGQNVSANSLTGNNLVCFDGILASNVSSGNGFSSPVTSNLTLFAGVLDATVAAGAYGLIQCYGARASIAVFLSIVSHSAAGYVVGPLAANNSAQSQGNSFAFGPIVLFDNAISGPSYARGFIRAM